jgi:hypothetical protein
MRIALCLYFFAFTFLASTQGTEGTSETQPPPPALGAQKLKVEAFQYRSAQWEKEKVKEYESEPVNRGGLLYLYCSNTTDEPITLKYWRYNGKDESYWRLSHKIAWDRTFPEVIPPKGWVILEINGTSEDFALNRRASLFWFDGSWLPIFSYETTLQESPVSISYVHITDGRRSVFAHVRNMSTEAVRCKSVRVVNGSVESVTFTSQEIPPNGHTIAHLRLAEPLRLMEQVIVTVELESNAGSMQIAAHRRAFDDYFPIGCWTIRDDDAQALAEMGLDTFVGPDQPETRFYEEFVQKFGFKSLVHVGFPPDPDRIRRMQALPAVTAWMLADEPDWTIPPILMKYSDDIVRKFDQTKPVFMTLCRNTQFFSYAPIVDIPCQDHYSVTAPSSSVWPFPYGTRLEETAYYTEDLKRAAEPKPIWVWSQALADWSERPKRPVPTPEELGAQLVLNVSRGAKGILWFNWHPKRAKEYRDVVQAMQRWSHILGRLRDTLLNSEPSADIVRAPDGVDAKTLIDWDKAVLCLTNLTYQIDPQAYRFTPVTPCEVVLKKPAWQRWKRATLFDGTGEVAVSLQVDQDMATLRLDSLPVAGFVLLENDADTALGAENTGN